MLSTHSHTHTCTCTHTHICRHTTAMCWQTFQLLAGFSAHCQTVDILIKIISVHSPHCRNAPKRRSQKSKSETDKRASEQVSERQRRVTSCGTIKNAWENAMLTKCIWQMMQEYSSHIKAKCRLCLRLQFIKLQNQQ